MPDPRVVLPLGIFAAMVAAVVALVWRVLLAGGRLRRDVAVTTSVTQVAGRADVVMGRLAEQVDGLRRKRLAPAEVADSIEGAATDLAECSADAQELSRRPGGQLAGAMAEEIDRACRAIEMIEHGRELLAIPTLERVGEGETEVKRGYLNLLHARDAMKLRLQDASARPRGPVHQGG